jgi:hypothetical protein
MKPDAYFPFYAADFWQSVAGQTSVIIEAYLRALTHYWCHTHCEGLDDDSEILRRICNVDSVDWHNVQSVVFR